MAINENAVENVLETRYASAEMARLWSPAFKFGTWRRLWIWLAESEKELGLPITEEQLQELRDTASNLDLEAAARYEKKLRHDVMAHVHAWGDIAPKAKGIIHLGATSQFVGCNTDLIQMRESLVLLKKRLARSIGALAKFADEHKDLPTLGFTHFQPAQPTTVGKRACTWIQDLVMDYHEVARLIEWLPFRGVKGTTGTQASFMELFEGDEDKIDALDRRVTEKAGFNRPLTISGQTYTRHIDSRVIHVLGEIAVTVGRMGNDIRLLQHLKEVEEPFEKDQIGSSAMAYKRNPMRSERLCALSRIVMAQQQVIDSTAAAQWFERTLDDSAAKRISVSQAFLAADACLVLVENIASGLVVYPKMIEARLLSELPFMATENILMQAVKKGGDRQELHELIRVHSMAAGAVVKQEGKPNDLLDRLAADSAFGLTRAQLESVLDPKLYVGRAPSLVKRFLEEEVQPILQAESNALADSAVDLKV
ncbi:MAG: adenylosuccinate lyase [Fibrobacteres bacterium]|nr:adenylosuccinate lyase [Fibrobacterota bacterium]